MGLGNPGDKYRGTRHNVGFDVVESLAERFGAAFETARYAEVATIKHKGRQFLLIKPSTFMNLSGKAVQYWSQKERIPLERSLVVTDDVSLPFGKIRIRLRGGAAGHNGLGHVIEVLGSKDIPRLRFGIGQAFYKGEQVKYVLSPWSSDQSKELPSRTEIAGDAVLAFGTMGPKQAMSTYNNH